ncbi:WSC domain-containing protein [Lactarius quietus]|nr:WSC domain-containing protein [Lactarius quietus]
MTVENCVNLCQTKGGFIFAGVEQGTDCYCGNVLTLGAVAVPASNCGYDCVGDIGEACGGSDSLSLYWNGKTPPPQPTLVQNVNLHWGIEACFNDSTTARTLSVQVSVQGGQDNNTVENCISACETAGYPTYAGVEAADECWCGKSLNNYSAPIDQKYCLLACSGNSSESCGGPDALVLYVYNIAD